MQKRSHQPIENKESGLASFVETNPFWVQTNPFSSYEELWTQESGTEGLLDPAGRFSGFQFLFP